MQGERLGVRAPVQRCPHCAPGQRPALCDRSSSPVRRGRQGPAPGPRRQRLGTGRGAAAGAHGEASEESHLRRHREASSSAPETGAQGRWPSSPCSGHSVRKTLCQGVPRGCCPRPAGQPWCPRQAGLLWGSERDVPVTQPRGQRCSPPPPARPPQAGPGPRTLPSPALQVSCGPSPPRRIRGLILRC